MVEMPKKVLNVPLLLDAKHLKQYLRIQLISGPRIHASRHEENKKENRRENNSQKVTFSTAVADLRVLCVQMREGD